MVSFFLLTILLVFLATPGISLRSTRIRGVLRPTIDEPICDEECQMAKLNVMTQPPLNCSRYIWGRNRPLTAAEEREEGCETCHTIVNPTLEDDMIRIEDTPVPSYDCENRANRTLIPGMAVRMSGIPGAELGVWAEKFFPEGIYFGPYGGDIYHYHISLTKKQGYAWTICCKKKTYSAKYVVDAHNPRTSNWVRYINCARNKHEQNLDASIINGIVYYVSSKPIQPGTELLVFYGWEFAEDLGIDREEYYL